MAAVAMSQQVDWEQEAREVLNEGAGDEVDDAIRYAFDYGYGTPQEALANLRIATGRTGVVRGDQDLIETLATYISNPYARNAIAGRNLRQLREAILLPDELARVANALRQELSCVSCGGEFVNGEGATAFTSEGGGMSFRCTKCYRPEVWRCVHGECRGRVGTDGALCEEHQGVTAAAVEAFPQGVEPAMGGIPIGAARAVRGERPGGVGGRITATLEEALRAQNEAGRVALFTGPLGEEPF